MLNVISLIALPVFVLSILTLAVRGSLLSSLPPVIVCQVCGVAVMVWARTTFPRGSFRVTAKPVSSKVLQTGPYRFVRHPIYAGAMLVLWASIAGHVSILNLGIGALASAVVIMKIVVEERMLRASYPEYEQYAHTTKTVIPFLF